MKVGDVTFRKETRRRPSSTAPPWVERLIRLTSELSRSLIVWLTDLAVMSPDRKRTGLVLYLLINILFILGIEIIISIQILGIGIPNLITLRGRSPELAISVEMMMALMSSFSNFKWSILRRSSIITLLFSGLLRYCRGSTLKETPRNGILDLLWTIP